MSWIQKLYETYKLCSKGPGPDVPNPISHTTQLAQIEIVIDGEGNFRRAIVLENKEKRKTLIPCTEESGGRTGKTPPSHPLCDKLQYIARDFTEYGGKVTVGFQGNPSEPHEQFMALLGKWKDSEFSHHMVAAIWAYLKKGAVIKDLVSEGVLPVIQNSHNGKARVMESFKGDKKDAPPIFHALSPGQIPMDSFVRFQVEGDNHVEVATWDSESLKDSWILFYGSLVDTRGFCIATGEQMVLLAENHPAKIRHDGDKAKLISSNDEQGYTFRGRFLTAEQAAGVSLEVTQKAHSALQWLIRRQAFRNGDQVFLTWAVAGKDIPDPCANSWDFVCNGILMGSAANSQVGDLGQSFAVRFKKKLAGYKANITDTEDIVVIGLDSAGKGRMAITFYRELKGSEFIKRIERWHSDFAWFQNYGKDKKKKPILFQGAPAPRDIAWCAYGKKIEGKGGIRLLSATVERLLPSIIDGRPIPRDLLEQCVRRTSNRAGLEPWEFRKRLGIACSLYKGFYNERRHTMALDEERSSRDYLYGRLLAVAEKIESMALYFAKEKRETTAARMMQRFADRPFSTWRTIETGLTPYKSRIHSKASGLLRGYVELLDNICSRFLANEFTDDSRLSGEFLLAYHCQRKWLNENKLEDGQWIPKTADDEFEDYETDEE